jgi:hypothetical protein
MNGKLREAEVVLAALFENLIGELDAFPYLEHIDLF